MAAGEGQSAAGPSTRRRPLVGVAVVVLYVLVSCALFVHLGLSDARLPTCACGDVVDETWYLALWQHGLAHGQLSFLTDYADYPTGLNLLDNASFPGLGILSAPLTALAGPVVTLSVLVRLGLVLSASAAYFSLRRVVRSPLGAAVGGLLYGFSPYAVHQSEVHFFLAFVPIPPIVAVLVFRLFTSPTGRPWRTGIVVGVLLAVQFLVDSEVTVSTILVVGLATVVTALVRRRLDRPTLGCALRLVAGAAGVVVVLLAYPAWYALAGPQHLAGRIDTIPVGSGSDLVSTVLPTNHDVLGAHLGPLGPSLTPVSGDTTYLGVALAVVVVVAAVRLRRSSLGRAATVLFGCSLILSLGSYLAVDGHVHRRVVLPFAVLARLPVFRDLAPSRLSLYVFLGAAALVAALIDSLPSARTGGGRRGLVPLALVLVAVLAAMPGRSLAAAGTGSGYLVADGRLRPLIAPGGVVLTYPVATFSQADPMLWQAEAHLRFRLIGGYGYHPLPGGGSSNGPTVLAPGAVESFFLRSWPSDEAYGAEPATAAQAEAALPSFVCRNHVEAIVVWQAGRDPVGVDRVVGRVYGPPTRSGPYDVWSIPSG